MKLYATAFLLITSLALAKTSGNPAENSSENFTLNQATQSLSLGQKDYQTLYRTDQVPDTCYRTETQGTRTECHNEYDHQCHMENRQQCRNEYREYCQTIPENICYSQPFCSTQMDSVCNSHGCVQVPRQVCRNEQRCTTQYRNVCRSEPYSVCNTYPEQICQDFPRQVCQQVPNLVQVPYACTKPVQVPIGQELKLYTHAAVTIKFADFSDVGALSDPMSAQLIDGKVSLKMNSDTASQYLIQIIDEQKSEQLISATEKSISATFTIQATLISKLNAFQDLSLSDMNFYSDRVEFTLSGPINIPMTGHLNIAQRRGGTAIDHDFGVSAIVTQGVKSIIAYNTLGAATLDSKYYYVTLDLGVDMDALKKSTINQSALSLIQSKPLEAATAGYPY